MLFFKFDGRPWLFEAIALYSYMGQRGTVRIFFIARDDASLRVAANRRVWRYIPPGSTVNLIFQVLPIAQAWDVHRIAKERITKYLTEEDRILCLTLAVARKERRVDPRFDVRRYVTERFPKLADWILGPLVLNLSSREVAA